MGMEVGVRLGVRVRGSGVVGAAGAQSVVAAGRQLAVEAAVSDGIGSQRRLYETTAGPQLEWLLRGADTSLVAFGRRSTGKTHSLLGSDLNSIFDPEIQGIIPRYVCELFRKLSEVPHRQYTIHITWIRLINGSVLDLLGCGLAKCENINQAMQYIYRGFANKCNELCHTVFTISIEQKWVESDGILHHQLSTSSFCELSSYPEPGLYSLEDIIRSLLSGVDKKMVNYEQSLLTAMLRDSFGGRAFTWILCCLDNDNQNIEDTLWDLEFCWYCRGIRNFVTINGFADNNTPLNAEDKQPINPDRYFGLQFAAQQWIKLVSNAEGLFQKILHSNSLSKNEAAQINEWLFLKAECDECLDQDLINGDNGDEAQDPDVKTVLPRITEDTEPSEPSDSDVDSDTETQHDEFMFADKLCKYMEYFREKTDEIISDRCEEFLICGGTGDLETSDTGVSENSRGVRRKTIRPGESLTNDELELLRRTAANAISPESQKIIDDSQKTYEDPESKLVQRQLLKIIDSPVPTESRKKYNTLHQKYNLKRDLVFKLTKTIQDNEIQLKELVSLCSAEAQLIQDLTTLLNRQNLKRDKRVQCDDKLKGHSMDRFNRRKCKLIVNQEKDVLSQDICKQMDHDNHKEIKKHENKLKSYKKQIEQVKKQIKRDEKRKNTLELELVKDKSKLDEMRNSDSGSDVKVKDKVQHSLKQMSARISNLDHVLKEKTTDLQTRQLSVETEFMLRREIRNLRKTRECLIDQRCVLGHKRKMQRSLSDTEERKLLEYEEAIEAIDTAIEFKNELICGRAYSLSDSDGTRERGEQLLMARLNKLSVDEMRTLLYKYFQKVIDLRTNCTNLEAAAGAAKQEAGGWRRRCGDAWAALQHARLAHARRTTTLTARHYHTLNQLMNRMTLDESDGSMYDFNRNQPLPIEFARMNHESDMDVMTQHRIATTKFRVKENVIDGDSRILDRIHQIAKFHQSGIPSQNLKQLQNTTNDPTTKVTRQKNKLVIIQEDMNK